MSVIADGPEAQNELLLKSSSTSKYSLDSVPEHLKRSTHRLQFPPSYVLVGVYRLCTDRNLYVPAWQKCQHGTVRGLGVGLVWAFFTFGIQKKVIEIFLANSPRVTGLATDTMFGYPMPFNVHTCACTSVTPTRGTERCCPLQMQPFSSCPNKPLSSSASFSTRNIRIARDRAWNQTVLSRGKGESFWQPYVEESELEAEGESQHSKRKLEVHPARWYDSLVLSVLRSVLLLPFNFYPIVGILISAWFKGMATSRMLHRRYFEAKKMTPPQVAAFMEEHKWDYRAFGFTAALLEGIPIIGLAFTISNRVGAAMWAFDLEKRQHYIAEKKQMEKEKHFMEKEGSKIMCSDYDLAACTEIEETLSYQDCTSDDRPSIPTATAEGVRAQPSAVSALSDNLLREDRGSSFGSKLWPDGHGLTAMPALVLSSICSRMAPNYSFALCSLVTDDVGPSSDDIIEDIKASFFTMVKLYIDRSRTSLLRLRIDMIEDFDPDESVPHPALSLLGQTTQRWHHLTFIGWNFFRREIFSIPDNVHDFPSLKGLEFELCDRATLEVFGQAPNLRCLEVTDGPIELTSKFPWPRLTSVAVGEETRLDGIMDRCPNLASIRFQLVWYTPHSHPPRAFQSLKSLSIILLEGSSDVAWLDIVLSCCICPSLTSLTLEMLEDYSISEYVWPLRTLESFLIHSSCTLTDLSMRGFLISDDDLIAVFRRIPSLTSLIVEDRRVYSDIASSKAITSASHSKSLYHPELFPSILYSNPLTKTPPSCFDLHREVFRRFRICGHDPIAMYIQSRCA
ncbi:hypothetical protein BT96DRAFT_1017440 [Gymnopus androsaceus JB14]|uniref:F-box domain-containing protein n=1 Tax=Gymnopus androsaceus JB14 TaxID=1447944 RepID=A0A6A4I1B6_9AGAR|nr:hypothetical protein BT96DRAFT_1017440 [Gymnopus androsaceus JB14]